MKITPVSARATLWAALSAGALFLCGCQVLTYSSPSGDRFVRTSLGTSTAFASLSVEADTNGLRRVVLQGYTNDSTQALGVVTDAAVRAALNSATK